MMPDDTNTLPSVNRELAALPIEQAIDLYAPNFAAVLPPNVPLDHFKRMVMTAISVNPDLISADRRTFFNSCVKCASDGLLPDGREAALVIYRTKVKNRQGGETWIDAIQYLPMIAGIRKRLRNSGEVDSATAEVVYRRDRFKYRLGDDAFIEHEPPALDEDRGDAIGAYAIIKLASGETIREVMGIKEIEKARAVSRAKDAAAGPWVKWWSEMARKTVLRRAAKAAPQAAMLEKLLARDDELIEPPPAALIEPPPPRPRREDFVDHQAEHVADEPTDDKPFFFTDEDGEVREFAIPMDAVIHFAYTIDRAAKARGEDGISGLWESNGAFLSALRDHGHDDFADRLSEQCGDLLNRARAEAAEAARALREAEASAKGQVDTGTAAADTGAAAQAGKVLPPETLPAAHSQRDPSKEVYTDPRWPHPPGQEPAGAPTPEVLDLIKRGDEVAARGTERLQSWWQHALSAFQRGALGARGRGTGPYLEAWKIKAAAVDAGREMAEREAIEVQGIPQERSGTAREAPSTGMRDGTALQVVQTPVAASVGAQPAAPSSARPAAPSAPAGDLLGSADGGRPFAATATAQEPTAGSRETTVAASAPSPAGHGLTATKPASRSEPAADRPNLAIAPVLRNGKPDWRAWTIGLFLPLLRKFNDDSTDLAYFIGDNAEEIEKAKAAGFRDELEAAISDQYAIVDGREP